MRILIISFIAVVLFILVQNGLAILFVDIIENLIRNDFLLVMRSSELSSYIIVLLIIIFFYWRNSTYFKFIRNDNTLIDLLIITILIVLVYFVSESVSNFLWSNDLNKAKIVPKEDVSFVIELLIFLNVVLLAPLMEELLFRGTILPNVFHRYGGLKSVLFTSILYMLAHVDFVGINYYYLGSVFIMGILYGVLLLKYGLFYSVLAHVTYNFLWYSSKYFNAPLSLDSWLEYNYIYVGVAVIVLSMVMMFAIKVFKKNNLQLICSD